jgi:hypothetical protein
MTTDTLAQVPPRVLGHVQHALQALHAWNRLLRDARAMETVSQQPGRYEADVRYHQAGAGARMACAQAHETLHTFEDLAQANGVDHQAVYQALGGKPALLDEGAEVHEWRQH